ncbi:acetylornithine transaminase [Erythrobacter sp. HI0019]|jgi:acetylornithine/N-succinyldiaminopimelate aminotransferase|uniref:aspartate aminotransferase family protein n=1 Tax=unclassified Erythrobacter TaxID=2633097 RepID=UPI0007B9AE52|nr:MULTISPECIES: aspartate aminotransferase family protein [unclassified Erythrobacter]MAG06612.1 acetylornithine transaminase [Sphingomonadaceae bacterium]HBK16033.1 acetylornithine transaminase [Erythrobacter sp.]KZX90380.1 acetylornithine transaminase [Erythrobacter sp. HI0019]KZY09816.1 acetylornithine transaminase [Erythrobacter sp. HI0028]KZY94690.1 acetylornithine transaminase [Erythrobacter sp. HI0074]|tara:strand:- start:535 stop:1722 length:1188 start_codon:yes stop_codon:yes gene_type:complete
MSISPLMPVYPRCGVRPVKGEHCHLIDEDGTRYLDFASGIAVNLLGHSHSGLIGAIQRQAETLMHVSNLYGSPQGEELAQMLVDKTFADTVFFTNSGAEAVEAAIKTARAYHQHDDGDAQRTELITFTNAFHGRTMATISASNQEKMHKGFMPLLPGFQYAEFDNLDHAKSLMSDKTAGFLVEPIQGEGGIRPGSDEFIHGLRKLADDNDLMLVFDEVQCGVARTGKLYAYEHYGIEPDIMATAKGIGGGFPLGACLATEKAARGMGFGTHGSTYGGNPLAMAAGKAVMEAVANDTFLNEVAEKGERLRSRLEQFIGNYPEMFELVRGKGLMLGLKMKVESRPFFVHLRDNHQLLTVAAGDNTLRILPPLVAGDAEFDEFFDKLSAGAASYDAAG